MQSKFRLCNIELRKMGMFYRVKVRCIGFTVFEVWILLPTLFGSNRTKNKSWLKFKDLLIPLLVSLLT